MKLLESLSKEGRCHRELMDTLTRAMDAPMHIGPCAPTELIIREASTSREFTFRRLHKVITSLRSGGFFKAAAAENCSGPQCGSRATCTAAKTEVSELDSSVGSPVACVRSLDRTRLGGLTPGCPAGITHGIAAMSSRLTPSQELPLRTEARCGQSNAGCAPPTFRDCTHMQPLWAASSFHLLRAGFRTIPEADWISSAGASAAPQELLGHPRSTFP